MPTTVLLTGFEPFGGRVDNPSIEVVQAVAAAWTGPEVLRVAELPVAFGLAADHLAALLEPPEPDRAAPTLALAVGLAAGRRSLSMERLAVNLCDARIPDNDGQQPDSDPVVPGGPTALWSSLPVKRMVAAARDAGCPAELSMTAGTYVCNAVFYQLARWAQATGRRAGFVHVPDTVAAPTTQLATGLTAALRAALAHTDDLRRPAGAVS